MDDIKEISISEAVVHILDVNSDEAILNESRLALGEELYDYLLKYIKKNINSDDLRYGEFKDGDNIVKKCAEDYFDDNQNIVEASKKMAKHMFALMKVYTDIPSCDFIIVSLETEYGPLLCALKIDYIKGYTNKIDFVNDKINIDIVMNSNNLPMSASRIQKCAFIYPKSRNDRYPIMFLDKKGRASSVEGFDEDWFVDKYLNCSLMEDKTSVTKKVIFAVDNWLKSDEDIINKKRTGDHFKEILLGDELVNIDDMVDELSDNDDERKQELKNNLNEFKLPEAVDIDKEWVCEKYKNTKIELDNKIEIRADNDTYENKIKMVKNKDGSTDLVIKDIKYFTMK